MIEAIVARSPKPAIVIVGEPTSMKVITAHKGLFSLTVNVKGLEAHSSLVEDGACAVTHAVPMMQYLVDKAEEMKRSAPAESQFDPPYGTLTIGQMSGGTAVNILAQNARFETLIRPASWDDMDVIEKDMRALAAKIEAKMRKTAPDAYVIVDVRSDVPAFEREKNGLAEQLARKLTGDNATRVVSYGTEAGQFQAKGMSVVVCGPGSINQAHQADEFIEIDQLDQCRVFMDRLASHLCV
jgi:acetylornithine deacetylase